MSGQPNPPVINEPFAKNAGGSYITLPIPVPSQIPGGNPGRASFNDGFPPATMTSRKLGGIPPSGKDVNGILNMVTAYLAFVQAGQWPTFDATTAAAMTGYKVGAEVAKADGTGFWFNILDGNVNNPDTGGAGWIDWAPGGVDYMAATAPAGITDDFTPPGFTPSIGFLDINPTAGDASIGSLPTGVNGQTITVSNINATHNVKLLKLDGSATQPKFRSPADITLLPNQSATARFCESVGLWLIVP